MCCSVKQQFEVLFDLGKFEKWQKKKMCYLSMQVEFKGMDIDHLVECAALLEI